MIKHLSPILVVFILLLVNGWSGFAQDEVTQTPTVPYSIFADDTCAPPCWMGLIPGESTAADVEAMLAENQDLIDPEHVSMSLARLESGEFAIDPNTGEVIRATYNFNITVPYFDTMGTTSRVLIREGIVYKIVIHAHERITLTEVLESFSEPEIVRMGVFHTLLPDLLFVYLDTRIRVKLKLDNTDCNVATLQDEMIVSSVSYFSPDAAIELERYEPNGVEQPALIYLHSNDRDVPLDLWQSWLDGEVDMSCEEAWELLPEPEITPVVEMTAEPESTKESK